MTLHAVKNSNLVSNYDFINNPVSFTSNSTGIININATSYGRALSATGTRLWNQSALALNSTNNLIAGQSLLIPFIASNLPSYFFDAVILLTVDGLTRLPYSFSNSPDNTEVSTPVINKNLYWADLYTFGLNNNVGNNNANNNYVFGGNARQIEVAIDYKINFSEPLTAPLTYTFNVKYISYTLGLNPYQFNGTITAPIGALTSTWFNGNLASRFFNNGGGVVYQTAGYFAVTFNITDPAFKSLLNVYHFGVAS